MSAQRIIHLDRDDLPACGAGEQMWPPRGPDHTTAAKRYFLEWHRGAMSEPGVYVCGDCAVIATEPEDKDDLYVEPEPLKEDDAVLLWARIVDAKPDIDGEVEVSLWRADGYQTSYATTYTLPDAIVRPDAGQVPPWVKPARCTSLKSTGRTTLHRCEGEEGHGGNHVVGWVAWTDDEEYGRMVESGGAS